MSYWVLMCRGKNPPPLTGEAPPIYLGPARRMTWSLEKAERFDNKEDAERKAKFYRTQQFVPTEVK